MPFCAPQATWCGPGLAGRCPVVLPALTSSADSPHAVPSPDPRRAIWHCDGAAVAARLRRVPRQPRQLPAMGRRRGMQAQPGVHARPGQRAWQLQVGRDGGQTLCLAVGRGQHAGAAGILRPCAHRSVLKTPVLCAPHAACRLSCKVCRVCAAGDVLCERENERPVPPLDGETGTA